MKNEKNVNDVDSQISQNTPKPPKLKLRDLLVVFLFPTLIGKTMILYFGLNYSNEPGERYGYGLVISILFTLTMIGRFLWKYRHEEDPT